MMNFISNRQLYHYVETEQTGFLAILVLMEKFLIGRTCQATFKKYCQYPRCDCDPTEPQKPVIS